MTKKNILEFNMIESVRSIQKLENKIPCFKTRKKNKCKDMECPWKKYCIEDFNIETQKDV